MQEKKLPTSKDISAEISEEESGEKKIGRILRADFDSLIKAEGISLSNTEINTPILAGRIIFPYDSQPNTLPLFFNTAEFSSKEISEIISELSDIYQEISGDPLVIRSVSTYTSIQAEQPLFA